MRLFVRQLWVMYSRTLQPESWLSVVVCVVERGCVWLCVAGCTGVLRVVCVFMCVYVCWCVVVLGHESNIDNSHAGPLR